MYVFGVKTMKIVWKQEIELDCGAYDGSWAADCSGTCRVAAVGGAVAPDQILGTAAAVLHKPAVGRGRA